MSEPGIPELADAAGQEPVGQIIGPSHIDTEAGPKIAVTSRSSVGAATGEAAKYISPASFCAVPVAAVAGQMPLRAARR
jgi:hypothetical protein